MRFYPRNRYFFIFIGATILVFVVLFFDVLFLNKTLRGEPYAQGVLPTGPVYYDREPGDFRSHTDDPGASSWNNNPPFVIALNQAKEGYIPWWNPYNGTGTPLLASLQSGIMFPPKVAILFLDQSPFMFDFYVIFRIFVAFCFTYFFLRLHKISRPISYVGAFAFAFSGSLFRYINLEHLNIDAFIPLYFFTLEYYLQKNTFRRWLLFAGSLTLLILGGFPEASLFAIIPLGLYFLVRWSQLKWNKEIFISFILANLSALLICLPIIIPFVIHMTESWTIHDPKDLAGLGHLAPPFLFALISPYMYVGLLIQKLALPFGQLHPGWIGGAVIILSSMALVNFKKDQRVGLFFAVFALISLLKMFGFPIINWLGYLPLINQSIVFKYNNPAMTFAFVAAAAFFLQYLLTNKATKLMYVSAVATLTGFYGYFIWKYHHAFIDFTLNSNLFQARSDIPKHLALLIGLTFIGFSTVALVLVRNRLNKQAITKIAVFLILLIIVFETYISIPKYHPRRDAGYPSVPFLTSLRESAGEDFRITGKDYVLFPDFSGVYQIKDPRILDAMYLKNFHRFVKAVDETFYDRFINLNNNWFNNLGAIKAMGVKDILTTSSLESAAEFTDFGRDLALPVSPVSVQGQNKSTVLIHPPFDKTFLIKFPKGTDRAYFYITMNPLSWDPAKGDGVCTEITTEVSSQNMCLDPKNNPDDRVWKKVLLERPKDKQEMDLHLKVDGMKTDSYDWAMMTNIVSEENLTRIEREFDLSPGFPTRVDEIDIYAYSVKNPKKIAYFPAKVDFVSEEGFESKVKDSLQNIDEVVIAQGNDRDIEQKVGQNVEISSEPNGDTTLKLPNDHPRYVYFSQAFHKNLHVKNQAGQDLKWYPANTAFILIDTEDASEIRVTNSPSNTLKALLVGLFSLGVLLIFVQWWRMKQSDKSKKAK